MTIYFDKFLQLFFRYRKVFALSFFFFGAPFTYFLREYIGLAPGSIVFTGVFTFGPLLMMAPFFTLNRLYAPNKQANFFYFLYAGFTFFYLLTFAPNRGWFTRTEIEVIYYVVWFGIVFLLMSISVNEIKDNFLEFVVIVAFFSCLTLIYVILKNPLFVVNGSRAAIDVKVNDEQGGGSTSNPHLFAKAAYAGIVALFILYSKYKEIWHKIAFFGLFFYFLAILGLTQSMQTILTLVVFFSIFAFYKITPTNIYAAAKWLFGIKGLAFFSAVTYGIYYIWEYTRYDEVIINVYNFITDRFERIFATLTKQKMTSLKDVDFSAGGRMETVEKAVTRFTDNVDEGNWITVMFGNGYQHFYVDSPIIQALNDLGIIGFIIFMALHIVIISLMIKEFRKPTLLLNQFICYFMLLILINQLAGGMPYDYLRYCFMAFMIRFCLPNPPVYVSQKLNIAA